VLVSLDIDPELSACTWILVNPRSCDVVNPVKTLTGSDISCVVLKALI
jgi:hypothetical protein